MIYDQRIPHAISRMKGYPIEEQDKRDLRRYWWRERSWVGMSDPALSKMHSNILCKCRSFWQFRHSIKEIPLPHCETRARSPPLPPSNCIHPKVKRTAANTCNDSSWESNEAARQSLSRSSKRERSPPAPKKILELDIILICNWLLLSYTNFVETELVVLPPLRKCLLCDENNRQPTP